MVKGRRRSKTIDLSNLTADQIQLVHADFSKEPENDENMDTGQLELSPRNLSQETPSKQQSSRRKSNRRVSFAVEESICEFDSNENVASGKSLRLPPISEQQTEGGKVQVRQEILEIVIGHFVGCLTSYRNASKTQLRCDLQQVQQEIVGKLNSVLSQKASNSLLVYGYPGSGKRLVVESAVQQMQEMLGVVRLSGFLHNDEASAFKEIAKQLCRQFGLEYQRLASQAENLEFFKNILREISRVDRGVVFVLWNMDKFAEKGKQGLLYNLHDVLQDSKVQACVIGVTCQLDIAEKFEKRVRSRMAMQKIFVSNPTTVQAIQQVLKSMLQLEDGIIERKGQKKCEVDSYVRSWNKSLEQTLLQQKIIDRVEMIGQCGYTTKHLARIAVAALMNLEPHNATITSDVLLKAIDEVIEPDGNWKKVIGGFTEAECLMLVSVCRLFNRGQLEVNFQMAFLEYQKCRQQAGQGIILSRTQAFLSFRNLIQQGIVRTVAGQQKVYQSLLQEFEKVNLNVNPDEIVSGLKINGNCSVGVVQWVKNEVIKSMAQDFML